MANLLEQLSKGLADAVSDIREKYEEAVFGRAVSDQGQPGPETDERAAFGSKTMHFEKGLRGPEALNGQVLSPLAEPFTGPPSALERLDHGTIIEGEGREPKELLRLGWPEARQQSEPGESFANRDREQGMDR